MQSDSMGSGARHTGPRLSSPLIVRGEALARPFTPGSLDIIVYKKE